MKEPDKHTERKPPQKKFPYYLLFLRTTELNNGLFTKKGLQGEAKGKIKRKIEGDGARQWKMKSKGKGKGKGNQKRKKQTEKKAGKERGKEISGLSIVNSQCI